MERSVSLENKVTNNPHFPIFQAVSKVLDKHGIEGYLVGGYVRDLLLERPTKDIDIVVIGSGTDTAKLCADALGVKKVSYFKTYGTAMFKYQNIDVEFVGARKESYRKDSRKPIVENGTLEDRSEQKRFHDQCDGHFAQLCSFW